MSLLLSVIRCGCLFFVSSLHICSLALQCLFASEIGVARAADQVYYKLLIYLCRLSKPLLLVNFLTASFKSKTRPLDALSTMSSSLATSSSMSTPRTKSYAKCDLPKIKSCSRKIVNTRFPPDFFMLFYSVSEIMSVFSPQTGYFLMIVGN